MLRLHYGLTQRQLAEQLGLSHQYIGDLETGRKHGHRHVLTVADFFGVPVETLMRDELDLDADKLSGHTDEQHGEP